MLVQSQPVPGAVTVTLVVMAIHSEWHEEGEPPGIEANVAFVLRNPVGTDTKYISNLLLNPKQN